MDEIKRWVLSLGPEYQVLEPERLKELVRGDLMETLGQYGALRVIPQTVHAHAKRKETPRVSYESANALRPLRIDVRANCGRPVRLGKLHFTKRS